MVQEIRYKTNYCHTFFNFSFAYHCKNSYKKAKWIQTKFGIYICFFQRVSIKSILLMRFQLKNEILASYSCSCISLIEDLLIPNCYKNYWAFGLSGLRTIGPSAYGALGHSDYWALGLSGLQIIGHSDYQAFGLSGIWTIGPSDYRTSTVEVLSSFCVCNHVTIFSDFQNLF